MDSPRLRRLLKPSYTDWLFAALLVWLFVVGAGWAALLADGDTGWHIRTGEHVLAGGGVPRQDLFSYTRPGAPWCAWEWGADVLFAALHGALGLKGVVLLAGVVIALYLTLLARHAIWRGASGFAAVAVCLLGAGASGIHYLARPHIFTLLLLAIALWLLEADRRRPRAAVWLLVPLCALWANLHAGFFALLVSLGLAAAGAACERRWRASLRAVALAAACAAASLANPYGWGLHGHVLEYLRSDWIREAVEEFQSPKFRSESSLYFELLLFAGLLVAGALLRERQFTGAFLILGWAHAALVSARHVPVFVVVAAPAIAAQASRWWSGWAAGRPARSPVAIFEALGRDFAAGFRGASVWGPALVATLVFMNAPVRWPRDFPEVKFPAALIERQRARLAAGRVFTSDQWGDYLIYRLGARVFVDGRSDFYGPELGRLYLRTAYAHTEWRGTLEKYRCRLVLAPPDWPLASLLRQQPGWRVLDQDARAVLFERVLPD